MRLIASAACLHLLIGCVLIHDRAMGGDAKSSADLGRLQTAAQSGSVEGQLALALAYDEGKLTERDPRTAAQWYKLAADKGSGVADLELGAMSETGDGVPQDYQAARIYYQEAIALGITAAKLRLGMMNLEGWGGARDLGAALSLLTQAAEAGDHSAQRILGGMYFAGVGVKADLHQALIWQEQAAKVDDPEAETSVGVILARLNVRDGKEAREWYQLSAERDYARGMLGMASTFLKPDATPEEIEMGRKWLELAAESGDGGAEYCLAGFYLLNPGYSAQQDPTSKARLLLEQSFKTGQFLAGEVLELASSGRQLADAWQYVQSVPMEQRYVQRFAEKLTEAAQNPSATHEPYPIKMVQPVYPMSLRLMGTEGNVVVDFVVDTSGRVRDAHAVKSTHPGFSQAAVIAVQAWLFMPASREGHVVFTHMQVPVNFRLTSIAQKKTEDPPDPIH